MDRNRGCGQEGMMAWARIDDRLFSHPKMLEVSLAARGLWLTALSYAASLERDGWFPASALPLFAPSIPRVELVNLAQELVMTKLWRVASDGYVIHDFLGYNRSRKELKRQRKQVAAR